MSLRDLLLEHEAAEHQHRDSDPAVPGRDGPHPADAGLDRCRGQPPGYARSEKHHHSAVGSGLGRHTVPAVMCVCVGDGKKHGTKRSGES